MTTTILELPREIIDLILTELAIASPQHDILRYALVTKATWSNFLLCRLYESVSLSSPAGIQKFIDCPVKDRYRITSLALAQTEGFYDHHNGSMLPLDVNLVLELLNSLQRQPLRNLELLGKRDPFPRGLWEHPLLAGLEWLVLEAGYDPYSRPDDNNIEVVNTRLKRLSFVGDGLYKTYQILNILDRITFSSLYPIPTITYLDLGGIDFTLYVDDDELKDDLSVLRRLTPFVTTLSLPEHGSYATTRLFKEHLALATSLSHFSLRLSGFDPPDEVLSSRLFGIDSNSAHLLSRSKFPLPMR